MQVKVLRPLSERDGVHPITTRERLNKRTGATHSGSPLGRLNVVEANRSRKVSDAVEQEPPRQRRRISVMAQDPTLRALNLIALDQRRIGVDATDGAIRPHQQQREDDLKGTRGIMKGSERLARRRSHP